MRSVVLFTVGLLALSSIGYAQAPADRMLPGERTAEQILNGDYPYPPSPKVEVREDTTGLAMDRLTPPPSPGVHPRILLSPQDLPDLRRRLRETEAGRAMMQTLRERLNDAIHRPGSWEADFYEKLASGDAATAQAMLLKHGMPGTIGHYQFFMGTSLAMEAFDAMVSEDSGRGKKVGTALATYARIVEPAVDNCCLQPLADDMWRSSPAQGLPAGTYGNGKSLRDLMGDHLLGYVYDFAYNDMTPEQRAQVRRVIAKVTAGRVWMGAELPHHFRNWNWIMCAMAQPTLALAIEGEEGYDPRVYKLGVQIARDYLTYGISPSGCSTEAVGYTQFGFVWGAPFYVAASRRGDNLLAQSHHRAMIDWYLHSMEPAGAQWQSHGDGGDGGPAIWTLSMWRYFYPNDGKIDFLWQNYAKSTGGKPFAGKYHIIEPLIWACDGPKSSDGRPIDYADGAKLNLPLTWFDPIRSSLTARSAWAPDATFMEFECRTDSTGPSHEHADRGNFTFSALGRQWAKESFRSVETRHHNNVLIDGLGQGYWPGPGKWLGLSDAGWALVAACDAKDAYDWWWPKQITTEPPDTFVRFRYSHWAGFKNEAAQFRKNFVGTPIEKETRPSSVVHFKGFEQGDPRTWDEDTLPVRLPHNPVQKAFRTVAFVRQGQPYMLVVDDIQKNQQVRLYEWLMMTGPNTDLAMLKDNDITLCDATVARDANGQPRPKKGDRLLLVRILDLSEAANLHDLQAKPSIRLEAFEKKDTNSFDGRSFGPDRRLVIPSRSVAPNFKILLFPYRQGDPLPTTTWNADKTKLTIQVKGQTDECAFAPQSDGRTRLTLRREGKDLAEVR